MCACTTGELARRRARRLFIFNFSATVTGRSSFRRHWTISYSESWRYPNSYVSAKKHTHSSATTAAPNSVTLWYPALLHNVDHWTKGPQQGQDWWPRTSHLVPGICMIRLRLRVYSTTARVRVLLLLCTFLGGNRTCLVLRTSIILQPRWGKYQSISSKATRATTCLPCVSYHLTNLLHVLAGGWAMWELVAQLTYIAVVYYRQHKTYTPRSTPDRSITPRLQRWIYKEKFDLTSEVSL